MRKDDRDERFCLAAQQHSYPEGPNNSEETRHNMVITDKGVRPTAAAVMDAAIPSGANN